MAEPARRLPDTRKPTPLRVVRGGDPGESEREILSLSLTPPPPRAHARVRARPLLLSERMLARWLSACLQTIGSVAMVRQYGCRAVLEVLYDGVMEKEPVYEAVPNANGVPGLRMEYVRDRLTPSKTLKSPGGYLRFLLREQEGRGR